MELQAFFMMQTLFCTTLILDKKIKPKRELFSLWCKSIKVARNFFKASIINDSRPTRFFLVLTITWCKKTTKVQIQLIFRINYEITAICTGFFKSKKYKLVICPKLCLFLVFELEVTVKTFLTNVCCEKRLPSAVVIL